MLEKIIALQPATVIASHKRPNAIDGINNVFATMAYTRAFGELKARTKDAAELYHKMVVRYPQRFNAIVV